MIKTLFASALVVAAALPAQAVTLVQWELAGTPGNQATTTASGNAANVTGSALTRGAGLTASAAGSSFSASGWSSQTTDYFSFGFAVTSGFKVDLDDLFIGTRSSNTGPGMMGLFYSGDSFATALTTFTQSGTNVLNSVVDLSTLPDLTGNVEFRLQQVGTTSANGGTTQSGGTFRVAGYFIGNTFDRHTQFTGTVTAIPEPGTYALLLAGLGVVGFVARRRRG